MRILPLLSAALLTSACDRSPAGEAVRIDGSPGVLPLVAVLTDSFTRRDPSVKVELKSGLGSKARIDSVESGAIDVAMASHGVVVEDIVRRGLAVHEIARSAVVFAVHSSVPVERLSRGQICDILSGKTRNWRELGGPDLAIAVLYRPAGEVDADVAAAAIDCLRGLTFAGDVLMIDRPDSMAAILARTDGGFGVTAQTMVDQSGGALKSITLDGVAPTGDNVENGSYALVREAYLVTRATLPGAVSRFLDFVASAEGERIVRANGAVPGKGALGR